MGSEVSNKLEKLAIVMDRMLNEHLVAADAKTAALIGIVERFFSIHNLDDAWVWIHEDYKKEIQGHISLRAFDC